VRYALTLLVLSAAMPAAAQPLAQASEPVTGFDLTASIGLFSADRSERPGDCCSSSSWSGSLFRGIAAGYYWTDHLKTEVEFGVPGPTEGYSYSSQQLANRTFLTFADERTYTGTKLSIAQAYQFGRNAPFHPYAFAGIDLDRERVDLERRTFSSGFPAERVDRTSSTALRTRGFTGGGFKAYVSERAFFKGEMKIDVGDRISQAVWQAGVGIDFAPFGRRRHDGTQTKAVDRATLPRGRDPVDVWRAYATLLPIGAIVDVAAAGDARVTAELLVVDDHGVLIKPRTRIAEPNRRITFDRLEQLRLHVGPSPSERFGAVAAGVGTGAGMFFGILAILFAAYGS
jgi:opacity protein-like surface antigen